MPILFRLTSAKFRTLSSIAAMLLLVAVQPLHAADLKIMSSIGVRDALEEFAPDFERQTGHHVTVIFDTASVLRSRIESGEHFDVAILTRGITQTLASEGSLVAETQTDIARSGVGIAVRSGAAKPDISTPDALRQALLTAHSIAYSKEGASGAHFLAVLKRLGILEQIEPRLRVPSATRARVADMVAAGEAELGVQLISEIVPVRGVELLGPLPDPLQQLTILTGAVGVNSDEPEVAREFLRRLKSPEAAAVIRSKGQEPG